jgi:glycosyltransferase involved in cell wall biosynthesis
MGEKGGWLRRMAFRLETAFLYRQANVVVAVSAGVGREVRSLYGIPQQRIRVIRNGVQRRPALEETRSPLSQIISAGRLVQVKGLDVLLRAFAIVRKKADSQLVIFGEGPERGALQSLAEALAVAPYVRFPGFVPDFWSHLGADALFVLSSRSESSSLVLVEAMQRGLPVVSTRCPYGPEEVIHDGIDGLLVPIDDPASLAQALLRLLSNQAEARMLAAAGRRAVLQYSVEAMVCEYQNLLLGLGASRLDESGEKL